MVVGDLLRRVRVKSRASCPYLNVGPMGCTIVRIEGVPENWRIGTKRCCAFFFVHLRCFPLRMAFSGA
jgi:hypothetical protein